MKFKENDKILQVSAIPNAVCYTALDKGPTVATVIKITPKMYRLEMANNTIDVQIGNVEQDFVYWTKERERALLKLYRIMREEWSKLYTLQISFLREDK